MEDRCSGIGLRVLRFIEAYGLWYIRPWAEWMAIASGSIYIPFEVADLLRKPDWIRLLILAST